MGNRIQGDKSTRFTFRKNTDGVWSNKELNYDNVVRQTETLVLPAFYPTSTSTGSTTQAIAINLTGSTINVTSYYTTLATGDFTVVTGETATLGDGTTLGQMKEICMITDGGDNKVVTFNTSNTLTFANVGEYAILQWNGTLWKPQVLASRTSGTAAPVLA